MGRVEGEDTKMDIIEEKACEERESLKLFQFPQHLHKEKKKGLSSSCFPPNSYSAFVAFQVRFGL